MRIKILVFVLTFAFFSCSEDDDVIITRNLQEYISNNSGRTLDNVIACAANENGNSSLSYIFYYPITGATDIQYFETADLTVDETNFENYNKVNLTKSDVFGGKLQRFSRSGASESWCIVTYLTEGKLHISNPIKLKNTSNATLWESNITIDSAQSLMPIFTWSDFGITDNAIYFQVISDVNDNFISGTYTTDKSFQFYNTSNVVLNINTETPESLAINTTYNFTLMAVSEDNWVNLVIQNSFVAQ